QIRDGHQPGPGQFLRAWAQATRTGQARPSRRLLSALASFRRSGICRELNQSDRSTDTPSGPICSIRLVATSAARGRAATLRGRVREVTHFWVSRMWRWLRPRDTSGRDGSRDEEYEEGELQWTLHASPRS